MTPRLENGLLITDLDCGLFSLRNLGTLDPPPANLVLSTDPRLSDPRMPIAGSVVDASVAGGAAIVQSKLNLNGVIPAAWLGTGGTQAAPGNLVEYLANKGQPNGYAALDGSGKIPSAQLPSGVGTGTVTSVGLTMPAQFSVSGSPVTGSGTLGVTWANAAATSWFGNATGAPAVPIFNTSALPASLIPSLDSSKIISGTIAAARLPVAVGLGGGHASGAVPDPGAGGGGALATDYLARDMTYKAKPAIGPTYQPAVTDPVLSPAPNLTGAVIVTISDVIPNAILLYQLSSAPGYQEVPSTGYVSVPTGGTTLSVYAAKAGWNNSNIVTFTNLNP